MNDHATNDELPELSDEDIELLHTICKRAYHSDDPPFRALFGAYDEVFAEQNIEPEHDGVVFRLLLRVGEHARAETRTTGRAKVDLIPHLKTILQAQGITVIDNDDDQQSEITRPEEIQHMPNGTSRSRRKRRNSYEDTVYSQRVPSISEGQPGNLKLLALRPKRASDGQGHRRTRSTSSHRMSSSFHRGAQQFHQISSSITDYSEADSAFNPTLIFEPSQTQLEQNAEAFLYTSSFRAARKCLNVWHSSALALQDAHEEQTHIAVSRDRRTLMKQALDEWRAAYEARRYEKRVALHWERDEERAEVAYLKGLARRCLTHWINSCMDQIVVTNCAKRHMLKFRYFKRWQAIALENVSKAEGMIARKFVAIWREKTMKRQLQYEQAKAHLEEKYLEKYYKTWFWCFCSRRVDGWHERNVMRRAFNHLKAANDSIQKKDDIAYAQHDTNVLRKCLAIIHQRQQQAAHEESIAQAHYDQRSSVNCMRILAAETKLALLARTMTLQVNLNLERKAFQVWNRHLALNQQAAEVQRKRALQLAWTTWNDALRCRVLAQKIDERILVENLYRWVIQERLSSFMRARDERLLRNVIDHLNNRVTEMNRTIEEAEAIFMERQRRRRLAVAMGRLYTAQRNREEGEKAAVEFANARLLPSILSTWAEQSNHCKTLDKWSADARFYTLGTKSLTAWKTKTTEHQQQRRRDAYARVRARIKIRLVGSCFARLRSRSADLQRLREEAERKAQSRLFDVGTAAFDSWRARTAQFVEMDQTAAALDHERLLGSALSALSGRRADIVVMVEQADAFKHESDLALLAAALKRIQWQQFTASRRVESADALWVRNRDTHIRHMLRYWCNSANSQRVEREQRTLQGSRIDQDEPESPSLRPASRAASRSIRDPPSGSTDESIPAYLRTPSRSRRSGRFRPLPTPAPITPFVFDAAYSTATPGLADGAATHNASRHNPIGVTYVPGNTTLGDSRFDSFTPQVTPFSRKLRAGGFVSTPAGRLKSSVFGRSTQGRGLGGGPNTVGGTAKSVRFSSNSRFSPGQHLKSS